MRIYAARRLPRRRRPGRRRRRHRRDRAPRQVRAPARRLRQPLRLRPPRRRSPRRTPCRASGTRAAARSAASSASTARTRSRSAPRPRDAAATRTRPSRRRRSRPRSRTRPLARSSTARARPSATSSSGGLLPPGVNSYDAWFAQPYTLDPADVKLEPLTQGLARHRRHDPRPRRPRVARRARARSTPPTARAERTVAERGGRRARTAPLVRGPPRRQGDAARRPEADPRRLAPARARPTIYGDRSSIVGGEGERDQADVGPGPADEQGAARERTCCRTREIQIYECGRQDIRAGVVDRRVLALLEFLVAKGMDPTVTSLRCGHGYYTKSGNVSEHTFGSAVDIAAINGTPIVGHQGAGSITDKAVRALLDAAGHDEGAPDHHADAVFGHGQHVRDGRSLRPHPRRASTRARARRRACCARGSGIA